MKVLRLADFECLYQQEYVEKICISCTTFSRFIDTDRKKIIDALIYIKALNIKVTL